MINRASQNLADGYYLDLAAAFVRATLAVPDTPPSDLIRLGLLAGLRLHKFKRTAELPRVRRVLGILRGLGPNGLLDVGSGRGVFLWPLLDHFPGIPVIAIDRNPQHLADIRTVAAGGVSDLAAVAMDVHRLAVADRSVDVVTILEVLEHLADPARAIREVTRVARRFVIASVPSHEDRNPEHIHLFDQTALGGLFSTAGAERVNYEYVRGHLIAVARVGAA